MTVAIGSYNYLQVARETEIGLYLDNGKEGILLPKRFVPAGAQVGQTLKVFVYTDSEDRIIATTQQPMGVVGDIVKLRAVQVTPQGAFLDFGLMKDLFVPHSKQLGKMRPNCDYLVKIYLDERTGRIAATEKFAHELSNEQLTVAEHDTVQLIIYRRTDLGYVAIVNGIHTGLLHSADIFRSIQVGDAMEGYVKKVYPDGKMDLALGKMGYGRVETEADKILGLLAQNEGFLPYHDKTPPDDIYEFFAMSKKTFKMTLGALLKQQKIKLVEGGIALP